MINNESEDEKKWSKKDMRNFKKDIAKEARKRKANLQTTLKRGKMAKKRIKMIAKTKGL